jgi:hypothetical protein
MRRNFARDVEGGASVRGLRVSMSKLSEGLGGDVKRRPTIWFGQRLSYTHSTSRACSRQVSPEKICCDFCCLFVRGVALCRLE